MNIKSAMVAASAALLLPFAASAAILYENPYNTSEDALASCVFNTTCATAFDLPPSQGGQAFSLSTFATIRSASFTELDLGTLPSIVRWSFYDDDGIMGAPGTLLASGEVNVNDVEALGTQGPYQRNKVFFNLPEIALGAGSYIFGLQVTAPTLGNFLVEGQAYTGAWERFGTEPWEPRYGGSSGAVSVAVGLYDTPRPGGSTSVPEPSSWALLIAGFGLAGSALRRKTQLV